MTHCHLTIAAALALAIGPLGATAQTAVAPPPPAASASPPGPRLATPAETRERAQPPDDVPPAGKAKAQISVPLGRAPPAPALRPRSAASAAHGIDDAAARCEAQADAQQRASCRDRLARSAPKR